MKQELRTLAILMISLVVLLLFFLFFFKGLEYLLYLDYKSEGYTVRYNFDGCEIKIENIDKTTDWRRCIFIAEPFVKENYGVKK